MNQNLRQPIHHTVPFGASQIKLSIQESGGLERLIHSSHRPIEPWQDCGIFPSLYHFSNKRSNIIVEAFQRKITNILTLSHFQLLANASSKTNRTNSFPSVLLIKKIITEHEWPPFIFIIHRNVSEEVLIWDRIHPWKLTCNLKMDPWKRRFRTWKPSFSGSSR